MDSCRGRELTRPLFTAHGQIRRVLAIARWSLNEWTTVIISSPVSGATPPGNIGGVLDIRGLHAIDKLNSPWLCHRRRCTGRRRSLPTDSLNDAIMVFSRITTTHRRAWISGLVEQTDWFPTYVILHRCNYCTVRINWYKRIRSCFGMRAKCEVSKSQKGSQEEHAAAWPQRNFFPSDICCIFL
jgi:hypothetical protein